MKESARRLALTALRRWSGGREFADRIVQELLSGTSLGSSDRAFSLELFYGVLRNLSLLDFWIAQLRDGKVDPIARDLLRLGLYQILLVEVAEHAAVFETVELASARARPLVNAILRRALREKSSLTNAAEAEPLAVRFSHPPFLVEKWTAQFGAAAVADLCAWDNQPAPVYVRINSLRISAADFLRKYPESVLLPEDPQFVTLAQPAAALVAGDCYIQDPSTVLACALLAPLPNDIVLDACAAPGGKSACLAGLMQNQGKLVAADRDPARLARLRENLVRLGVAIATVEERDWLAPATLKEASFDKILIDAPCSNTGVMRRRVDVRWRLRPDDFPRMQAQQLAILQNVAPLLQPGGSLVYSTCSLEPEENEEVVAEFLRRRAEFRLTKTETSLPFRDGIDGAFAARLELS